MQVTRTSPFSGKTITKDLDITPEQIAAYQNGAYIQDAFPNLSADDREFIKTGITAKEWDELFGSSDELYDISTEECEELFKNDEK